MKRSPQTRSTSDGSPVEQWPDFSPGSGRPAPFSLPTFLAAESEKWLGRVGVGFVILAFAFLLKLSFDRGWITPALRLGAGFAAGTVLVGVGLRLEGSRRRLAQAMLGGGVALFYLVGFAGSQLYEIIPVWAALSLMSTTTVLAIVLSERQDSSALAVIGVFGGLATPFLLDIATTNPSGVAVYASLVLLGAAPVQFLKGWPGLLVAIALGGSVVAGGVVLGSSGLLAPSWPLLALVGLYWASTVLSPALRPIYRSGTGESEEVWLARLTGLWGTAVTAAVITFHFSLDRTGTGFLLLGLGLVTIGLAFVSRGVQRTSAPAAEVGALVVAAGLAVVTWSSLGMFLVMAEVCALLMLASRQAFASLETIGHWLGIGVVVAFLAYAQYSELDGALGLRVGAFLRLGVLTFAVLCALWTEEFARFYRGAAYVGLSVWLLSELVYKPNGQALISVAWSIQGTTALLASIRHASRGLQITGLLTLGLVAAKLILVDLAELDPVWRILIFLGFGATLLGLGYLVNRPANSDGQGISA